METWKEAFRLAKFEWKHSKKHALISALGLVVVYFLLISTKVNHFEEGAMGIDFFFVLIFSGILSQLARPQNFQMQKFTNSNYRAPFLVALNHLPVTKQTIATYRLITYFITMSAFNGLLLIGLYPAFMETMDLNTYIAFAIIWFCVGIYLGGATPAFEAGSNLGWNIFYACIFGPIIFFLYIFAFYKWYENGLISWTIWIANEFPVLSATTSFFFALVGWKFWEKVMLKRLNRTDYL